MRKFAAISLAGIMAFGALPVMAEETSTEEASTEAATEVVESDQVENNWEPFAENVLYVFQFMTEVLRVFRM